MGSRSIVVIDEGRQAGDAAGGVVERPGIGPLTEQRPDEALGPYIVLGTNRIVRRTAPRPSIRSRWLRFDVPMTEAVAWSGQGVPATAGRGAARLSCDPRPRVAR